MYKKALVNVSCLLIFSVIQCYGQLNLPVSFTDSRISNKDIPIKIAPPIPSQNSTKSALSQRNTSFLKKLSYGTTLTTSYNVISEGAVDTLDGFKIFRLGVKSVGAKSLSFKIVVDGDKSFDSKQIFVYTPSRSYVSNTLSRIKMGESFFLPVVPGDCAIVEVKVPVKSSPSIKVVEVAHGDINPIQAYGTASSSSGSCNVDIACPPGEKWLVDKNSVVKIIIDGSLLCTGTLINNTAKDRRPLLLTANHCINSAIKAQNSIFYFGNERTGCNEGVILSGQTISGATLLATGLNGKLDFTLLELSEAPPQSYQPYYAGWDIRANPFDQPGATGIHHPNGDVKKISVDNDTPATGNYSDLEQGATFDKNSHWHILNWEIGTTEGGSSGSALFSSNHLVVGTLTGGEAQCGNSVNDYYSKLNQAWSNYPLAANQLKSWLDPAGKGDSTCTPLLGFDFPYAIAISNFNPCSGDTVTLRVEPEDANLVIRGLGANVDQVTGVGSHKLVWTLNKDQSSKVIIGEFIVNGVSIGSIDIASVHGFPAKPSIAQQTTALTTTSALTNEWYYNNNLVQRNTSTSLGFIGEGKYFVKSIDQFGCGSSSDTIDISYSSKFLQDNVIVYPIPVQDQYVYIKTNKLFSSPMQVNLYDMAGRKLNSKIYPEPAEVEAYHLVGARNGMYILEIIYNGKKISKKIVAVGL